MHILFLTWKDIKHPHKWGAEVVMHNYMKRLVEKGHTVTWFASGFSCGASEEVIDGINIIRRYTINTIYFSAWRWFREFSRNTKVDCIVDEAGGIPLLSPLYAGKIPVIFFIHHIGDKEWEAKFPFPFGIMAKRVFTGILRLYRKSPTVTVSESTRKELIGLGFDPEKTRVIENALDFVPVDEVRLDQKEKMIAFVGRLAPIKRVEDAIQAFSVFFRTHPDYTLKIIGQRQDDVYTKKVMDLASSLNIRQSVVFLLEMLTAKKRNELLSQSKVCLIPSEKEGFGLVVLESNAFGTPVIAYDVPGLRDTVRNDTNGYLVPSGDYESMGNKLSALIDDEAHYEKLAVSALAHVKSLPDWDKQTDELEKLIQTNVASSSRN